MALEIIGAGLGRTGTLSLKHALDQLGFGPCYHMQEVFADAPRNLPLWTAVVRGNPDWDAVFAGYRATVDYPACTYWRELAELYPQAKIILSTRDPDSWFDSVSETIFSPTMVDVIQAGPPQEFITGTVTGVFGDRIRDRAFMTDWFRRWESDVIASVPGDRLLVVRPGEGWQPLCDFLGVPIPETPYPRVNEREAMLARMEAKVRAASDAAAG